MMQITINTLLAMCTSSLSDTIDCKHRLVMIMPDVTLNKFSI